MDVETKKGALWAPFFFFFFLALSMLYVTTMPGQHIKGLRGSAAKHGHTVNGKRSPTFCAWDNMVRRCTKPNNSNYGDYGARGVRVADVFLTFDGFLKEVGERPGPGYSLERLDNNGHYEPGNVVWATKKAQQRNRRTNHKLTFQGETLTVAEWAERTGIRFGTILSRLRYGWSVQKTLASPLLKTGRPRTR